MMSGNLLGQYSYLALAIAAGAVLAGPTVKSATAQTYTGETYTGNSAVKSALVTEVTKETPTRTLANRPEASEQADYQTLYVDSQTGSDRANGVESEPLRTVTRALEVAPPNTVIVLAPGRYSQGTGEVFPLQLKPGVTIQGTPGSSERTAIIEGGGSFNSPTRSQQNAAIIAADRAGIAQIAVSNPDGYGVWIESASPTILESAFVGNRQTGIYVAGGSPRVHGSYFSGNQVAGLIVFGTSTANIQQNIFDGTGDAIRVLEGATPEIVGNRITNNDAGLVLVGNAQPVVRDNQIVGNRRNEVVEVAARRNVSPVREEFAAEADVVKAPEEMVSRPAVPRPAVSPPTEIARPEITQAPSGTSASDDNSSISDISIDDATAIEIAVVSEPALTERNLPEQNLQEQNPSGTQLPAGAPGSALQALQSGLALGPRAVTGENPDAGSLIRNRRRRRPAETESELEGRPAPPMNNPVNNNRLAVPNTAIPIGSGSSTVFSPPSGGAGAPPAPPSRAQALGLYYRVFVEASDPFVQDEVREVIPDAFRTRFEGRTVMQVGAFPTEDEAEERKDILEDNNFNVRVEYIR
ncbi:MAG: DUF1565 domain-containing protein [Cyanobacteria bacterium J06621_11]